MQKQSMGHTEQYSPYGHPDYAEQQIAACRKGIFCNTKILFLSGCGAFSSDVSLRAYPNVPLVALELLGVSGELFKYFKRGNDFFSW